MLIIVAGTKFTSGAWVPLIVVPSIIAHLPRDQAALHRVRGGDGGRCPKSIRRVATNHSVVVPVGRITKGTLGRARLRAVAAAEPHRRRVPVARPTTTPTPSSTSGPDFEIDVPLEIVHSPYRDFVDPFVDFLDELEDRWGDATITVVIPEFVVNHWYEQALHNQTAARLKLALLFRPRTVVTSVPYHLTGRRRNEKVLATAVGLNFGLLKPKVSLGQNSWTTSSTSRTSRSPNAKPSRPFTGPPR